MPATQTVTTTVSRKWVSKKKNGKSSVRKTKPRPKKGNPPKKKR